MNVVARTGGRAALAPAGILLGSVALLATAVAIGHGMRTAAALTLIVAVVAAFQRAIARWHVLVGLVVLIIMFIPIRRYQFGSGLPFDLEPYRIVLFLVALLWIGALLADPRVRLRRSFLDGPLLLFLFAVLGSILTNTDRLRQRDILFIGTRWFVREDLAIDVLKAFVFLLSFYVTFYFVVSVVRDERTIHSVLKILVGSCAVVAFSGIVEARTGYNVFDHLQGVLPSSSFSGALSQAGIARGGRLRVYASAQHPIALATMLVMMLPLAIYLARHTRKKRWALSALLIGLGALATVSRTSITTLAAIVIVFIWLRRGDVKRLWPLLVPALLVIHIALPGTIGSLREAFFPPGGLIADQTKYEGRASPQRLGPEFQVIAANPAFGQGYGTRITEGGLRQNARVLDNQWLGTATETGLVGVFAWLWLFGRFIRRAGREAKRDLSSRGWLLTALTSSVAAFAVGMLTYDAFSFIQVTFVLFILAALGACTLATEGPWPSASGTVVRVPARFRRPLGETP